MWQHDSSRREENHIVLLEQQVCSEDVLNHKALFVRGGLGCSGKRCSSLLDSKSDTLYEHVPDLDALNFRALQSYSMQYSKSYSVDLTPSTMQHMFNYRLAIEFGNTDTQAYGRHETLLLGYCKQIDYALELFAPRVNDQSCIKQIVYSVEHFLRLLDWGEQDRRCSIKPPHSWSIVWDLWTERNKDRRCSIKPLYNCSIVWDLWSEEYKDRQCSIKPLYNLSIVWDRWSEENKDRRCSIKPPKH